MITWLETEYLSSAAETIQTVIISDEHVVYVHYQYGYYSLIEGVVNLNVFLMGNVSSRFFCTDSETEVERVLRSMDK